VVLEDVARAVDGTGPEVTLACFSMSSTRTLLISRVGNHGTSGAASTEP
jgi:hypothetical protein